MGVSWPPPAAVGAATVAAVALCCAAKRGHGSRRGAEARSLGTLGTVLGPLLDQTADATDDAAARCTRCFYGPIIHSLTLAELQIMQQGLLGVDATGRICFVVDLALAGAEQAAAVLSVLRAASAGKPGAPELVELGSRMLIPGFVDAHAHAPQHAFTGTALDLPLLEWLERYTFPHETKFADVKHARNIYSRAVRNHLKHGSTTVSYFATIHLEACKVLVEVCREQGQRAYVGKVNMDRNSPETYCEETQQSLRDTRSFVDYVLGLRDPLITPVVTPRFVPSCTPTLMRGLAKICDEHQLPLQSHLSENLAECDWVRSLHPDCTSYSDVYDKHGLYTPRSYMAHCVHCARPERDLVLRKGVGIVHCPNSNFTLASGVCNVREWLEEGNKVGLGTDVAGGYSPSILNAIRMARVASVAATAPIGGGPASCAPCAGSGGGSGGEVNHTTLSYSEIFYLATLGGARVLGLEERIGNFTVRKEFDALVIDAAAAGGNVEIYEHDCLEDHFQKFLTLGDDRNIEQVYVRGQRVL